MKITQPTNQNESSRKHLSYAICPYRNHTGNQRTRITWLILLTETIKHWYTNLITTLQNLLLILVVKRKKRRWNYFEIFSLPFEITSAENRQKNCKTCWWLQNKDGLTSKDSHVSVQRKYQGGFFKIAQCWSKLTSAEVNNQTPCGRRVSDFENDTHKVAQKNTSSVFDHVIEIGV